MSCTERQMGAAIVILEVLIRAEMQLSDDSHSVYMLLAHQVDVIGVPSLVDNHINTIFLTEPVDIVDVPLCEALNIGQEETRYIIITRHACA